MKKNKLYSSLIIMALLFAVSCGSSDPKVNGKKAGKIKCEIKELRERIEDIEEDIRDKDWEDDEERAEISDLRKEAFELELELTELYIDVQKLENKQWNEIEDEDDRSKWIKKYRKAFNKAEEDCD